MLRPAHCSLYLLCSQERKEKKSLFFFPFSLQQIPCHFISSVINGESEIGVILVVWLKTKPQFCSV